MSEVKLRDRPADPHDAMPVPVLPGRRPVGGPVQRLRLVPVVLTLISVALAAMLGWGMWRAYMAAPWTRDATVRAYVVTLAPQVAGRIVQLPVKDNQYVHKGQLIMKIDPTDFVIAVDQATAAVAQAKANAEIAQRDARRRAALSNLEVSVEEQEDFAAKAIAAEAVYRSAVATLAQARVNLYRTNIRSPVDGYVTNLLVQQGDYASVGEKAIALVDAHSFWLDGYFEETNMASIHLGEPARIKLLGYSEVLTGHVQSIARGIEVPNAQADPSGLANVNPIFTWVRLAQRVPVRIQFDHVPPQVQLVAGMTATVEIERSRPAPLQPAAPAHAGQPEPTTPGS